MCVYAPVNIYYGYRWFNTPNINEKERVEIFAYPLLIILGMNYFEYVPVCALSSSMTLLMVLSIFCWSLLMYREVTLFDHE